MWKIIICVVVSTGLVVALYAVTNNQEEKTQRDLILTQVEGEIKTNEDGTAYVTGTVIEHISGCEVDSICALIVQTGSELISLVYAEGERECLNSQVSSWVNWGVNVKQGTPIQAYGTYHRINDQRWLTFCDSKEYFILGANDPVPNGDYVKKF